jgi:hypothetical protein
LCHLLCAHHLLLYHHRVHRHVIAAHTHIVHHHGLMRMQVLHLSHGMFPCLLG